MAEAKSGLPPYDGSELLSIIQMLPDVVFRCVKGDDGNIYWTLNEGQLAKEFGLTTAEIQGKTLDDMFPGGPSDALRKHFEDAFAGKPSVFINEIDGRFFKHFPQPVYAADGTVEALVGFITEVTESVQAQGLIRELNGEMMKRVVELNEANDELKVLNENLHRANSDLDAFAHTVSHDLRTPLTVIQNFGHVLELKYAKELDESGLRYVSKIRQAASRLDEMIGSILRFSRASRSAVSRQDVDLSTIAREVAEELDARDPERKTDWKIDDHIVANADPGLMRSALENLLGNAWKYASEAEQPAIAVTGTTEAGATTVSIRDNGMGFTDEEAKEIFEAFTRLEGGRHMEGTGIGLATVQRIVERHGGTIGALGVPGEGATFTFTIPAPSA